MPPDSHCFYGSHQTWCKASAEKRQAMDQVSRAFGVPPWLVGLAPAPRHVRAWAAVRRWCHIVLNGYS
jgi:hypothetical protein